MQVFNNYKVFNVYSNLSGKIVNFSICREVSTKVKKFINEKLGVLGAFVIMTILKSILKTMLNFILKTILKTFRLSQKLEFGQ